MDHEIQTQHEAAAATVCAVYFLCWLGTACNIKVTGFKLYIPLSIAALARTAAFATRAAYYGTGITQLVAASRALQAIGLGISIAMCSCFVIVWLRNAQPTHQPVKVGAAVPILCKCLVGCVIAMGPFLGIVGAGLANVQTNDELRSQGLQLRQASATGFLVLISMLTLITGAVVSNWLRGTSAAANRKEQQQQFGHPSSPQQQQQQQQQRQKEEKLSAAPDHTDDLEIQLPSSSSGLSWYQQLRGDGLILVLLLCDVLLLWSASASLASLFHPALVSNAVLHYPIAVLPEMIVAVLFAWPRLVARIALGGRFYEWRQEQVLSRQQQQQQQNGGMLQPSVAV